MKTQFSLIQISEEENPQKTGQSRRETGGFFHARRKEVDMVLHITKEQEGRICDLVRKRCANYYEGNCLLLNGLDEGTCVQLLCRNGIFCRYFHKAVLPGEQDLYTKILAQNQIN